MAGITLGSSYLNDPRINPYSGTPNIGGGMGITPAPTTNPANAPAAQQAKTNFTSPSESAIKGLTQAGAGSSYNTDSFGNVTGSTVTPNLIPAQTASVKDINSQQAGFQSSLATQQAQAQSALAAQQAQAEQALLASKVSANNQTFDKRLSTIQSLPPIDGGGGGTGGATGPNPQAEQAARDAAFAREKEKIGQIGRGALTGLSNSMSERGVQGGGYEQKGIADIVAGGQGQLGDVAREQTIQDLTRAQQLADLTSQQGLQKRGQDVSYRQSLLGLLNSGGTLY